jgi:hypothetical protein
MIAMLCVPAGLSAQTDPPAVAELIERTWFEGLPIAEAAQLDEADGLWLATQLADPDAAAHHGNIAMALGACACGPAFEALEAFASDGDGPGTPPTKSRRALPQAMGLLARHDPRALAWLQTRAQAPPPEPDKREPRRLYALVLQGLGQSGAPAAGTQLAQIEARAAASGDAATARWARQALRRWRQSR